MRNIELALGSSIKQPSPSESKNRAIVRKSLFAKENINKGDIFTEQNLTIKRPGTGINPMRWDEVLGTKATKNYQEDDMI